MRVVLANFAAATAALSAGAAVVATRLVVGDLDPASLAFYRYVIAVLCLLPLLPILWPRAGVTTGDVARIALFGAVFYGFFPWAFSASLQYTPAARGAIGLATIPIQTLIVAALLGREVLTRAKLASVCLAFAGVALVFGREALAVTDSGYLIGDGLMLLGAFSAAVSSVLGRPVLAAHGPLFVTVLAMAFGVVALSPLAFAGGAFDRLPELTQEGWLAVVFLGTVGGAIQFSLFAWALRWLQPTRTVIYLALNPISAVLLAVALLGENLSATLVLGLVLVLSGILVANLPRTSSRDGEALAPQSRPS